MFDTVKCLGLEESWLTAERGLGVRSCLPSLFCKSGLGGEGSFWLCIKERVQLTFRWLNTTPSHILQYPVYSEHVTPLPERVLLLELLWSVLITEHVASGKLGELGQGKTSRDG